MFVRSTIFICFFWTAKIISWWMAVVWSIWKMRNRILFSNDSFNGSKLVDDAVFLVWSWLSNLDKDFKLPFNLWSSHIREGFLG